MKESVYRIKPCGIAKIIYACCDISLFKERLVFRRLGKYLD